MKKTLLYNFRIILVLKAKQLNVALLSTTIFIFFTAYSSLASSGIFESYAILKVNNNSNAYYDMQATTVNTDFNGANLGSFTYGTSIKLAGAETKTFKNGSDNIIGATLFYRVYSSTPGAFSNTNLPFGSNLGNGDQSWTATGTDIELSKTLSPGTYTIELYTTAAGTWSGGSYTLYSNNGGSNYKATFSISAAPLTITGITANNKTYDENTTATLSGTPSYVGLQNGETFSVTGTPSASFTTATVGTGKTVTVTGYNAPSSNYTVSQPAGLTANIIGLTVASATDFRSQATGNLTAPATWQFDEGGGSWVTSTIIPTGKNIAIQNGHAITVDADYTVASGKTFIIANGGSLIVSPTSTLTISGTANLGGQSVTLQSTSITNGGAIGTITGTLSNATNVTVQRYSQAQRGYRTFAHPYTSAQSVGQLTDNFQVTGLTSGALGTYGVGGSTLPSAFYYDGTKPAGNAFVLGRITKSDSLAWGVGKGLYVFVRGNGSEGTGGTYSAGISPVTLDVTNANINQGDVTVSLTPYTEGADNFTLVGNPYPCPINLSNVTNISSFGTIYLQNPTYSAGSTTSLRGGFESTSDKNIVIPSMGCFYIQSTAITPSTITFHESDKVASGTSTYAVFGTGAPKTTLGLEISTSVGFMDRTKIAFDANASSAATDFYDAGKLGNNLVTFYSLSSERKALGIDYRKTNTTEIIPLGIQTAVATNYTIKLSELSNLPNTQVVLKDKLLNKETVLSQVGDSYSFDITADATTKGENRFEIGLLGTTVLPVQIADITAQLQTNKTVAVNWTSTTEVNLASYKVQRSKDGSNFSTVGTVAARGASAYNYTDDLSTASVLPSTIYYRLEALDKDGSKTYSKVVAVALGSSVAKASINIYPNPVQATLFAQVTVTKAGTAQLKVVDAQGKVVATQKTQLAVGTTSISIPAAQLPAGSYVLEIETTDGKQTQRFVKEQAR